MNTLTGEDCGEQQWKMAKSCRKPRATGEHSLLLGLLQSFVGVAIAHLSLRISSVHQQFRGRSRVECESLIRHGCGGDCLPRGLQAAAVYRASAALPQA